ncbi:MAG: Ig-like domain-containing protein [Clostridiales Family XIII bacterium]|nr:Ig-like domain-containing protein [Clostridiales Family XIII bacterium]
MISLVAETNNEDSITLCNEDGCKKAIISGTHVEFSVSMYAPNSGLKGVDITGTGSGNVVISDTQNGVLVSGATGEVSFVANDLNDSNGSIRKVEVIGLGGDILFYGSGKSPISVSGAVRLSSKWYNSVHGLHVCRMADPNRLLLYWNRVRPAAGYNIYRYDPESRSYNKIVSLAGKSSRAWVDGSAQQGKTYRYRVAYYTYSASPIRKKRTGAMSYSVSGVTEHDTYGNALSVKVNKGKLKGSVGGSAKLTVSVIAAQGKRVVSGAVRWYTSNARVATVSPSGRVMFKGKGKCYVYAKAHDGINSRNVRVEVS